MFLAVSAAHRKLHVYYLVFSKGEHWEKLFCCGRPIKTGLVIKGIINLLAHESYRFHITPFSVIMYKWISHVPLIPPFWRKRVTYIRELLRRHLFSLLIFLPLPCACDGFHYGCAAHWATFTNSQRLSAGPWGKGHLIIVRRDRRQIAAPKSFGIMSVVTVNKSSQTIQCITTTSRSPCCLVLHNWQSNSI